MTDVPIREWPEATRPRERLLARGAGSLSDTELLAILIGTGTRARSALDIAQALTRALGGPRGPARADPLRVRAAGIGGAATARILAACEVRRRVVPDTAGGGGRDPPADPAAGPPPPLPPPQREAPGVP